MRVSDPEDEAPIESVAASLSLLSPQSMKSKDLNALWGIRVTDRQLEEGLKDIIERPEFHRWLSRNVFKDLNAKQIGQSLQRASFGISYPDGHEYINELDETRHATTPARPRQSPKANAEDRSKSSPSVESRGASLDARGTASKMPTAETGEKRKKAMKMKTSEMVEKGLLPIGTVLTIKNHPGSEARVIDGRHVDYQGTRMTFSRWGMHITGWPSIQIYAYALLPDGSLLDDLRN